MARSFNGTSDKIAYADTAAGLISAAIGTMAIWVRPRGTPVQASSPESLSGIIGDGAGFFGIGRGDLTTGFGDGIYCYNFDSNYDVAGFSYTNDVWTHVIWRHAGGFLEAFKNGVAEDLAGSNDTGNLGVTLTLGTNFAFFEGDLAEWGVWDVKLTDEECLALGKGFSPLLIRPQNLTRYSPLLGRHSPEPEYIAASATTLTGTGAAVHPRVFNPSGSRVYFDLGGATAALTGTALGGITEADVVAGGKTIVVTLTGDTWIPA